MSNREPNQPWRTYNNGDCSQGICSIYCPQWCYIVFLPPSPPLSVTKGSTTIFSPLGIALLGLLLSVLLLVLYCTFSSSFRTIPRSSRRIFGPSGDSDDHTSFPVHTFGLDEASINSISVFKFRKEDGFIQNTDCSVCLSEFREDENLRLLPKCNHAFHIPCIDSWLISNSKCPLCRAIVCSFPWRRLSSPNLQCENYPVPESEENNVTSVDLEHISRDRLENADANDESITEDIAIDIKNTKEIQPLERLASVDSPNTQRTSMVELLERTMDNKFQKTNSNLS